METKQQHNEGITDHDIRLAELLNYQAVQIPNLYAVFVINIALGHTRPVFEMYQMHDQENAEYYTGDYHIFQVFVNDLIYYEAYLNGGNLELPIKIPITDSEDASLDGYSVRVIVSK